MSRINLIDVANELSTQLGTILNGRTTPFAPDTGEPPFGYVFAPESTFDASYRRGLDVIQLSVTVAVGRTPLRTAWAALGAYTSGSGAKSVKQVLEAGTYTSFDTIQVTAARVGDVTFAGVDYKAAGFDLTITGSG